METTLKTDPRPQLQEAIIEKLKTKGWNLEPDPESKTEFSFQVVPLVPTTQFPILKIFNPSHHRWRHTESNHKKGEIEFTRVALTEFVVILFSPPVPRCAIPPDHCVLIQDWAAETLEDMVSIL